MRRLSILALSLLTLAAWPAVVAAQQQGMTTVRRTQGTSAQRGKWNVAWVQLTPRFANATVRARVNADLEREARRHICEPESDPRQVRYYDAAYQSEVTYLGPRLLGVRTYYNMNCGGPYPAYGVNALLYDLRTGRRLEVEGEMADARAFRRFVARRALAARPPGGGQCAEMYTLEELTETSYVYILGNRGLTAEQQYPHVIQSCGYETRIPHADIVRFLKPGSPLRALVPRRR
jgi:hypothetical protein